MLRQVIPPSILAALLLSACESMTKSDKEQVQFGSLTQHLELIGNDGKHYGTVELDPVGQGKVYDYNGKVVGRIIPPQ